MSDELRRNMALFPISTVMKLTDLSARQIRYYEQHGLVRPARTKGNQRLFSFNDVERLLEIKSLIEKGVNIAGIKQMLKPVNSESEEATVITPQTDKKTAEICRFQAVPRLMKQQMLTGNRSGRRTHSRELARFFKT